MTSVGDRFSLAADVYDGSALIQKDLAVELARRIRLKSGSILVDIGTGTGVLSRELCKIDSSICCIGLDVALGMLVKAQGARVLADQAALPFKPASLDGVVSASCYQWSPDLKQSFTAAASVLKPGGKFAAVFFGEDTLRELFQALGEGSGSLAARLKSLPRLPSLENACAAMGSAGFSSFDFEREFRRVPFASLQEVLRWISATGGNGLGRGIFIGKEALARAEEYYRTKMDQVMSFEILWLEGIK